mmetsp:Transcript_9253/g.12594  ORF Transcript_9253/g.12594 Transcript_9253/m.12594 type:complete len:148 (+) Transcript_9253:156-599(+)
MTNPNILDHDMIEESMQTDCELDCSERPEAPSAQIWREMGEAEQSACLSGSETLAELSGRSCFDNQAFEFEDSQCEANSIYEVAGEEGECREQLCREEQASDFVAAKLHGFRPIAAKSFEDKKNFFCGVLTELDQACLGAQTSFSTG